MGWDGVLTAAEMIQRGSPRFQQMLRDRKKNKTWMTCQLVIRMPDFMSYLCIILYIYTSSYIFVLPMSPYILFSSRTQDRSWPTWPIRCRLWSCRPFKIHSQRGRVWWAAKGMIKFLNFEMLWNPQSLPSLKLAIAPQNRLCQKQSSCPTTII